MKTLLAWGHPRTRHPHPQLLPPAPCKHLLEQFLALFPSHSSQIHFPPSLSSESIPPCQHPISQSSQQLRPKHPNSSSRPGHLQASCSVLHTRFSLHNHHCGVQGRRPGSEKAAGKPRGGAGCRPRRSASPTPASPVCPQGLARAQTPKPQALPTSLSPRTVPPGYSSGQMGASAGEGPAPQAFHTHFSEQPRAMGTGTWLLPARGQDRRPMRLYFTTNNRK